MKTRDVAVGVLFVLIGAGAWWTMSGVDVGPDVPAASPKVAAAPEPVLPSARPARPPGEPQDPAVAASPSLPVPAPADAPTATDLAAADDADPADDAHFHAVAVSSMTAKLGVVNVEFAQAASRFRGAERENLKRVLDDAYGEMRDVSELLSQGQMDIGEAFGEIERIRDRAGREIDATLPPDRAASAKSVAGVRTEEEAASAIDWGIPVDEATADEIFK